MTNHQRLFGAGLTMTIVDHLGNGPMTVVQLLDAICIQTSLENAQQRHFLYRRIIRQLHVLQSIERLDLIALQTGRKTKKYKVCLKK